MQCTNVRQIIATSLNDLSMACAVSYRSFSAFSLFFSLYAKRRQVPVNDLDWFVHYVILQEEGHVILDGN
jgi:hypothetical protein